MMDLTVLLVFCNLIIFSHSEPDPEVNLHIHLPPEEGALVLEMSGCSNFFFSVETPDIGGGKVKTTKKNGENNLM